MTNARRNKEVVIEVTTEDIAQAIPKDSGHCMIADALGRGRPDTRYRSVDLATIRWSDPKTGKRYIALTPTVAQRALLDFDHGKKPEPFIFRVRPVQIVAIRKPGAKYEKPTLTPPDNHGTVPIKIGGQSPPLGALHGGQKTGTVKRAKKPILMKSEGPKKVDAIRTGRIRGFGLRGMGR